LDHVLAGQETAGVALTYLSWRLSQSLELQIKLRRELLSLEPNMKMTGEGLSSLPDLKLLDGLPILHAVVMETLRLHAPIQGPQPRQTPYPASQIGPYHVPGGVRVAASAYTLHRDSRVFHEPERWDHARWLDTTASGDEKRERHRQFWAFGSGGRMCIGSNFAVQGGLSCIWSGERPPLTLFPEMKLIVAAIYSNFTTHIVDDAGMADQTDGYISRPANEYLYLRLQRVA
jgi:cytochrome P450